MTTFGNSLSLRVDGAIGSMSLSPNGRDAVLAGRKGLFVIDLDDPFTPPRWLHHITSWEVADVQWSPHRAKPAWCVSTSNQKALLWDLSRPSANAISSVLHRHTRAITDIHFHPQEPEMLATCSIDTFVFAWDMRQPRRPTAKYAEWRAGATQVKWNSANPHQLASSHHHSFLVWDQRMGARPLWRIDNAHAGKINGLDFSASCDRLVTCANDRTVKFWDMRGLAAQAPKPTIVIHTDFPVARARRLPFGRDNCCGLMPVRGGDNAVHIVNYKAEYDRARASGETVSMHATPDFSFRGHGGPVKDFLWRTQHEQYAGEKKPQNEKRGWKEYQLVTWSAADGDLRLWPHASQVYAAANYNPQHQVLVGPDLASTSTFSSQESLPLSDSAPSPSPSTSESGNGPVPVDYRSFVGEPATSFADFSREAGADVLSRLAAYTIQKNQNQRAQRGGRVSQLSHLSWISGVRMGPRSGPGEIGPDQADAGPANLGEEISIVGHKFSKVRFEKISVSTGHIEISMRGPLPNVEAVPIGSADANTDVPAEALVAAGTREKRDSVSDKSVASPAPASASASASASVSASASASAGTGGADTSANAAGSNIPHASPAGPAGPARPSTAIPSAPAANTTIATGNVPATTISSTNAPASGPNLNSNANSNANTNASANANAVEKTNSTGTGTTNANANGNPNVSVTASSSANANANASAGSSADSQDQKLVFIRLEIKFPRNYPFLEPLAAKHSSSKRHASHRRANQIRFDIEETHELGAAVRREMVRQLDEIAHFFANQHHHYCLEPCLRYLMGEKIDLEEAAMAMKMEMATADADAEERADPDAGPNVHVEVGSENWVDDLLEQHEAAAALARMSVSADEDDEDEDADLILGPRERQGQSRETSSGTEIAYRNGTGGDSHTGYPKTAADSADSKVSHDSTPLPKGCGAVWTHAGELVCFFIPKAEHEPRAEAQPLKKAQAQFPEKAQAQTEVQTTTTPTRGVYVPHIASSDESDGVDDSEDDTASCMSDTSSDSFADDWDAMVQDDMPSGGRMPGVFRDSMALGRHMRPGEQQGRRDSGSGVGDDGASKSTRRHARKGKRGASIVAVLDFSHLVPAKHALAREYRVLGDAPEVLARHNGDVAARCGYAEHSRVWRVVEMLLAKNTDCFWGHHPLGHAWLVGALFRHFEARQDVQMLAMLACLLHENEANVRSSQAMAISGGGGVPLHTPYASLPARPLLSSVRDAGLRCPENIIPGPVPEPAQTPEGSYTSARSARSVGTDQRKSVSRKPSAFAFASAFHGTASASSEAASRSSSVAPSLKYPYVQSGPLSFASPPYAYSYSSGSVSVSVDAGSLKNPNFFSRLSYSVRNGSSKTGKNIAHKSRNGGGPGTARDRERERERERIGERERERIRPPPAFTIEMKNTASLDLYEDHFAAPLLSGLDPERLAEYREQYAEMLYLWGLPLHRIKILKFNHTKGASHTVTDSNDAHKCSFGSRHRRAFSSKQQQLTPVTPIGTAKNNAWNTAKRDVFKYCGYCGLVVSRRVVICTKCEHIVHPHCAAEWWAHEDGDSSQDAVEECPTGCGCSCLVTEL